MGILEKLGFGRKAADPLALWAEIAKAGRSSKAGATINLDTALRVGAWFACVNVVARGCAQVPFKLFRETQEGGLTKILPARDHRLYDRMATMPNDWQTSFEFRETLAIHAMHGNAYAWKNRTIGGISELIQLDPGRMCVEQPDEFGAIVYKYTLRNGATAIFPAEQIWHVRGPSWCGYAGMDVLKLAREALGLAIMTEESHANLHSRGVRPTGVYSVDGNLSPEQHAKLTAWLKKEATENAGAPMVVDRAAKWFSTTMSGMDAQHLETRRFQIEEVCRFAGVHPQKVYHFDKTSTYASAEEFANAHREDTMGPWYMRIEQSADASLLTEKERKSGLYFKFVANALLRASAAARAEYYAKALGSGGHPGWMTPDEVRALEEMNPMGGEAAKLPPGANKEPPALAA